MTIPKCICGNEVSIVPEDDGYDVVCPDHEGHRRVFVSGDDRHEALMGWLSMRKPAELRGMPVYFVCPKEDCPQHGHLIAVHEDDAVIFSGSCTYCSEAMRPAREDDLQALAREKALWGAMAEGFSSLRRAD